jgi:hypothetical protein
VKVSELTEQLQRRRSKEELEALKQAPDYWKTELRKELNALVKRYGASSKELAKQESHHILRAEREVFVLASGEGSVTLHRDKRARALLLAIGKLLYRQAEQGRKVIIGFWAATGPSLRSYSLEGAIKEPPSMDDIALRLNDASRLEETIKWLHDIGERGEKLPVRFTLRFSIVNPEVQA